MRRLAAALVVAGTCAAGASAQEPRPADPLYDCPWIFRRDVIFHGVLAERAPIQRGAPSGRARQPSCNPYPKGDRIVPVFRLGRSSPLLALLGEGTARVVYVRRGTFPQLPDHPAHRVIHGSRRAPDARAGLLCGRPRSISGRVRDEVTSGAGLVVGSTTVTVDARTRVSGGRRIAGQPEARRGDGATATVRTCRAGGFGRVVATRLALRP